MSIASKSLTSETAGQFSSLDPADPNYAVRFADVMIENGVHAGASDLHLQPTSNGMELRWRIDGVLHAVGSFPRSSLSDVASRLKVLADLLTRWYC
ncbi:MAG: hypothetical protein N2C12_11675 [Planctomycetales bacterium]